MRRRGNLVIITIALLVLAVVGIIYQNWAERRDAAVFPIPGRLVDVGGYRLHLRCVGNGSPLVVMIAGAGSPSVNSYDLQDEIAKTTRVCSYDRAGLGWSDPPPQPMGLSRMADDLHNLLARSGEKGSFLLVPESFGGTLALQYATRYPDQISGIVAVDPTEPSQWYRVSPSIVGQSRWRNALYQTGWRLGVVRLLLTSHAPAWTANISPRNRGQFDSVWSRPMASFTDDYVDAYEQTPKQDVPEASPGMLGRKPVTVISHGRKSEYLAEGFEADWPEGQRIWSQVSREGKHVIAKANTHMIAQESPDLVAKEVSEIVKILRVKDAKINSN